MTITTLLNIEKPTWDSPLIGLMGHAGSGKDTVALRLRYHQWLSCALADSIREAALALDPYIVEPTMRKTPQRLSHIVQTVGWDTAKNSYPEIRRTLQRLGTEAGTLTHGEDLWTRKADIFINCNAGKKIVITDIRMPHEIAWLKEKGGIIIKIERNKRNALTGSTASHMTEKYIDSCNGVDAVINNDGTIGDLYRDIETILSDIDAALT